MQRGWRVATAPQSWRVPRRETACDMSKSTTGCGNRLAFDSCVALSSTNATSFLRAGSLVPRVAASAAADRAILLVNVEVVAVDLGDIGGDMLAGDLALGAIENTLAGGCESSTREAG